MEMNKIFNLLLDGAIFDGSHHKQYYIKQALIEITGSEDKIYELLAEQYDMTVPEYIEAYGKLQDGIPA